MASNLANGARVGISAWHDAWDLAPLGTRLDEIAQYGVDTVEIPGFTLDLIGRGRVLNDRVKELRTLVADRPYGYTFHGPIGINFMDDPFRLDLHFDVLKASIEIAAELKAEHHILHTGIVFDDAQMPAIEEAFSRQREFLTKAGDFAEDHGVILTVENVFTDQRNEFTALPSRLSEEIFAIDHPHVWACFDFSHGYINATLRGADWDQEYPTLTRCSRHLHIHDSYGQPNDITLYSRAENLAFGLGDLHLPLGLGDINFDAIMDTCVFPRGVIFNFELDERYWPLAAQSVEQTKVLAARANIAQE